MGEKLGKWLPGYIHCLFSCGFRDNGSFDLATYCLPLTNEMNETGCVISWADCHVLVLY